MDFEALTTQTCGITNTPAYHRAHQHNRVEASTTPSDISLRRIGRPRKVQIPTRKSLIFAFLICCVIFV